jgi:hypothetical protein
MRLLNSTTLEFKFFNDEACPPYAILSHVWGAEEVSYQNVRFLQQVQRLPANHPMRGAYVAALEAAAGLELSVTREKPISNFAGLSKIEETAKIAKEKNLDWFWVDTCCIDKSSSAELQEAINSMYAWYKRSAYCIVYLEGPDCCRTAYFHSDRQVLPKMILKAILERCKWVTRGWTLQELIAPTKVGFYDNGWNYICDKSDALHDIQGITRIPQYVLTTGDLNHASVAQKMSWAAHRSTTRVEDIAYSLMGLFNIHMPMLYGEGVHSFQRLQEEIIKTTADDSIFAWQAEDAGTATFRSIFARCPREFKSCFRITKGDGFFTSEANQGIRLRVPLQPFIYGTMNDVYYQKFYLARLDARRNGEYVTLILQSLDAEEPDTSSPTTSPLVTPRYFARVLAQYYGFWSPETFPSERLHCYLRPQLIIPPAFQTTLMHCFYFQRGKSDRDGPQYYIAEAWPPQAFNAIDRTIMIPENTATFVGLLFLKPMRSSTEHTPLELYVGFNRSRRTPWCKLAWSSPLSTPVWPSSRDPDDPWWVTASRDASFFANPTSSAMIKTSILENPWKGNPNLSTDAFEVHMETGLWNDKIAIIVHIDGLLSKD